MIDFCGAQNVNTVEKKRCIQRKQEFQFFQRFLSFQSKDITPLAIEKTMQEYRLKKN